MLDFCTGVFEKGVVSGLYLKKIILYQFICTFGCPEDFARCRGREMVEAGARRRAKKVCGGALRVFERVRGVRVCVNAHRGTTGMMTHQEKLARGRAILAAYRAFCSLSLSLRSLALSFFLSLSLSLCQSLCALSLAYTHAHACGVASSNSCASCVDRRVLCVRSDNVVVGADILNISLTIFGCRT
jgi:hypothetical protein